MKSFIFFIFTFVFSLNFFAQNYTPTLELNKVWNMHHYDETLLPNNYDFNISLDYMVTVNEIGYFYATNGDLFREDLISKKYID